MLGNPYLPSWEYIPDGEPYVFDGRVYIYGSHDQFDGQVFCLGNYMCWSAPISDLGDWRSEGEIYPKTADPLNKDGRMCLYAPDVTVGPDGRYYLYYVLDKVSVVSVAVCDKPAGKYEFLGYVHYKDGTRLGEREGDEPQFDPGVLTEDGKTYLYTGFCSRGDKSRTGSMLTVLGEDMLTIEEEPVFVVPGIENPDKGSFEGHEFFEASSIRKRGDKYYFIYSSIVMHELCYAVSDDPRGPFTYGGVIVSNADIGIDSYKPADMPTAFGANNHGSIVQINDDWYIFYHRHTNGTWFSRQGCAEKIHFTEDGAIPQVEITTSGLSDTALPGKGEHLAYTACNLFTDKKQLYVGEPGQPKIKERLDFDSEEDVPEAFISDISAGTTIGYKYYSIDGISSISIRVRGYGTGCFEVRTEIDGPVLAELPVEYTNIWTEYKSDISLPDGDTAIYFTYTGDGSQQMLSFTLE